LGHQERPNPAETTKNKKRIEKITQVAWDKVRKSSRTQINLLLPLLQDKQ
jgi:hypothetical protein